VVSGIIRVQLLAFMYISRVNSTITLTVQHMNRYNTAKLKPDYFSDGCTQTHALVHLHFYSYRTQLEHLVDKKLLHTALVDL
jgi:hypothetical protein